MYFTSLLNQLADQIHASPRVSVMPPGSLDPHLASSVLQKALRRGDQLHGLAAALSLAQADPPRLWRRLAAIACEDFSLSNLDLTARVVAAASDGDWRKAVGGDAAVVCHLIPDMMSYPRDRRTDELAMWSSWARLNYSSEVSLDFGQSAQLTDLLHWGVKLNAKCEGSVGLSGRQGYLPRQCDLEIAAMRGRGWIDDRIYLTCLRARRASKTILPVMLGLLWSRLGDHSTLERAVYPPPVDVIAGTPSYGLDGFTRLGQAALWRLAKQHRSVGAIIAGLRAEKAMRALTAILFEVEGGVCTRELYNPLSEQLRNQSRGCWSGLGRQRFDEGVRVISPLMPELNCIRRSVVEAT